MQHKFLRSLVFLNAVLLLSFLITNISFQTHYLFACGKVQMFLSSSQTIFFLKTIIAPRIRVLFFSPIPLFKSLQTFTELIMSLWYLKGNSLSLSLASIVWKLFKREKKNEFVANENWYLKHINQNLVNASISFVWLYHSPPSSLLLFSCLSLVLYKSMQILSLQTSPFLTAKYIFPYLKFAGVKRFFF